MAKTLHAALAVALVSLGVAACAAPPADSSERFGWHPLMLVEPSTRNGGCP